MQTKFEKVKKHILEPMHQFYGGTAINSFQVDAYVEDLGNYSVETLQKAWKEVRRNSKSRPNVAHFISAIKELNDVPVGISNPIQRKEWTCKSNHALADEMMRHSVGKLALGEGVGNAVWMLAFRDEVRATPEDVRHQKGQWNEAVQRLIDFPNKTGKEYQRLHSLYEAFVERERELEKKYA